MAEIQDAVPRFWPCPTCERVDRVENVAVVREHAVETAGRAVAVSPAFGGPNQNQPAIPGPTGHRPAARPTPLGRKLSLVPLGRARPLVVLGAVSGAVATWSYFLSRSAARFVVHGSQHVLPPALTMIGGAVAAVSLLLAAGVRIRRRPVRRGRTKAEAVSRLGWYCGRCGTVYFQPGPVPEGAQDSTSYSLVEFRRFVFRAGGYEHLVNVRSVR